MTNASPGWRKERNAGLYPDVKTQTNHRFRALRASMRLPDKGVYWSLATTHRGNAEAAAYRRWQSVTCHSGVSAIKVIQDPKNITVESCRSGKEDPLCMESRHTFLPGELDISVMPVCCSRSGLALLALRAGLDLLTGGGLVPVLRQIHGRHRRPCIPKSQSQSQSRSRAGHTLDTDNPIVRFEDQRGGGCAGAIDARVAGDETGALKLALGRVDRGGGCPAPQQSGRPKPGRATCLNRRNRSKRVTPTGSPAWVRVVLTRHRFQPEKHRNPSAILARFARLMA